MKPDGDTMETNEPTEAAAVAEPSSSQDNVTEQAPSQPEEAANDAAPGAASKANGKPVAAEPKVKPKALSTKTQPAAKSAAAPGSRPGTAPLRTANVGKSFNQTAGANASAKGAVAKRPVGGAAVSSTVKSQSRVPDKKPVGPTRTTSVAAATATSSSKPTAVNGIPKKRPVAETCNVARPKTTAIASRATAPKPSTSTTTKAGVAGASKTTRPAAGPLTSRPAFTTSRPTTSTFKPSTTTTAKTAASRVTTAPSTGRTTAALPPKPVAVKKDVSRPPSAVAKKPTAATTSAATKKLEPSKPTATVKHNPSKWSTPEKAAGSKMPQSKTFQPANSSLSKKPVETVWSHTYNKQPLGRTPPASPINRPANGKISQAKRVSKPSLAVSPFNAAKKTGVSITTKSAVDSQRAAGGAGAAGAAAGAAAAAAGAGAAATVLAATQAEATESLPQGPSLPDDHPAPEDDSIQVLAQDTTPEVIPEETAQRNSAASSLPQSPVKTALPQTFLPLEQTPVLDEQTPALDEPALPPVACSSDLSEEAVCLLTNQSPSPSKAQPAAANAISLMVPLTNLNEEEDEEEREGSQLVSVSEMSGTTQPTEESRPGSAGPVGGSVWRAGGALLSELDSEEVSGSQQGASELSAPGVLEGTESMDDLGDGSLKGAIDMEGASAGSPDFEKVPDIPANDFDDEDDDDDRVCDMDVGSERADEPQRLRHDNDVAEDEEDEEEEEDDEDEEEEDEDVEMASEGVTESGLESYGNLDEDDFAEDERLDNLNKVVEPPPPPLLPCAMAAQWDQPNQFADPWGGPQPQQGLEHASQPAQVAGAAAASPLADPWQADSNTPTRTQAWLELGSASFFPENREVPHCSIKDEPQNVEAQMNMDQSCPALMQTMAPALLSAPGMSLSSTLSSETSTPEELCDYNRDGKLPPQDVQASLLSTQPDQEAEEEAEAETLPADEVLGGPATAPTSNQSSTSVTEDEASDTEGEALLDDSESLVVRHMVFDSQPPTQRCLSIVDEVEEATMEVGPGEDTTPPSATSFASYGFDTMTTASNSNAQSTGESCIKSPGIFSLEELPEEAKEPGLILQPHTQPCLVEQQYIDCGKQDAESAEQVGEEAAGPEEALDPSSTESPLQQPEENPDDIQPPYYSAICEKTDSFAGLTALPHRRDHSAYPRTYCDILKPLNAAAVAGTPPRLTCADLPPRSLVQQALSPQLRRLEQHQRQLLEMQQRRDQQSRPLEESEQERKTREEEEQRRKKEEAEEEIKRNEEALEKKVREQADATKKEEEERLRKEEERKQRRDLELQLQQQQQELKERQQIMQWQQELQQSNKGQTVLLSPSSGLCTIYEALETSDEEEAEEEIKELNPTKGKKEPRKETSNGETGDCVPLDKYKHRDSSPSTESPPPLPDSPQTSSNPSQDGDSSSPGPPESPERPAPLDLDWGKKVDIVQQLINQTLLLNRDGCSSLLLLPGGAGGTLSPLESSLWPSLLPPLTPPSATVTSVSSFSPEATGSSPQGEWTVVELETHH
ncbi:pneumococcal serine-rich repeat protein [Clinocottus analis]|uniref:pneumococcal serine-rich repeat protein n=1 Tax=Clinocottus analis TaxID=304258 RepID=UPI0035C1C493